MGTQHRQLNLFDPARAEPQASTPPLAYPPPSEPPTPTPSGETAEAPLLTPEQMANLSPEMRRQVAWALWWHENVQLPRLMKEAEQEEDDPQEDPEE